MDTATQSHVHSVLIVADTADMREAYETMLRLDNFDVTVAAGGPDALDRLGSGLRPCVVLLDFCTPFHAVGLRQRMRTKPELATTAVVLIANGRDYGPGANGDGTLRGPVDADTLRVAFATYCRARRDDGSPPT